MTVQLTKPNNRIPAIFNSNLFDEFFVDFDTQFDKFFGSNQVVPYDVIQRKDASGNITATEIQYALAGYDKDNIFIEIDDDVMSIKINKDEKVEDKNESYLHKGISRRRIEFSYGLSGYNKEKISSSFRNGILKVILPVSPKKEVKRIDIEI